MRALISGLSDNRGPLGGYPLTGVHLQVTALRQDADTTSGALRYAASMIVADAVQQANAILLEPVMNCEVGVPLSYLGHVLTDLTTHR
jgi:elongation factor G